jgi:hypothetical protein
VEDLTTKYTKNTKKREKKKRRQWDTAPHRIVVVTRSVETRVQTLLLLNRGLIISSLLFPFFGVFGVFRG